MDDVEQATVIDPTQVGRMASSRTDGAGARPYTVGTARAPGKPRKARPGTLGGSRSWRLL